MCFKYLVLSIISLFSFVSCNNSSPSTNTSVVDKTVVAVIFCDLTTRSIEDTASIQKVARDAYQLVQVFPANSHITLYPVDSSPFVRPILEYTKPRKPTKPSDIQEYELENIKAAKYAAAKILQLYRDVYSKKEIYEKSISCLTRTLETANQLFSQYRSIDQGHYIYELLYLSDMIEECGDSPVGHVSFRRDLFPPTQKNLKNYQPHFDLSYANVSVIVTAEKLAADSKFITAEQLKDTWDQIFMKVGFSPEQLKRANFLPTIPPRFRNKYRPL